MLTFEVQRVSSTFNRVEFKDDAPEHVTVAFPGRHISDLGIEELGYMLTLQSQGWCARAATGGSDDDSQPPAVRVDLVPGTGIEVDDAVDVLRYEIGDALILTKEGALWLREALEERVPNRRRLDGPVGYLAPESATVRAVPIR
jgi:hypothetical protein